MLVVLALIAMLAGTLAVAALHARRLSVRVECQSNMHEIGTTLNSLMLTDGGKFPELGYSTDNSAIPWWARVFDEWRGVESSPIDTDSEVDGLQLPVQLPGGMKSFHCRAGGALQNSPDESDMAVRVANLFDSISYGPHFDIKDKDGKPYHADRSSLPSDEQADYSARFPGSLDDEDKAPDEFYATEIKDPSRFILLSEADTQNSNAANWTGGRITMGAIARDGADMPPANAPIVGRHDGFANVLFADMSMDVLEVDLDRPDSPGLNVNANTPLWTLPAD